jgi:hypothetical protein
VEKADLPYLETFSFLEVALPIAARLDFAFPIAVEEALVDESFELGGRNSGVRKMRIEREEEDDSRWRNGKMRIYGKISSLLT